MWAQGVASLAEALEYTNRLILDEIERLIRRSSLQKVQMADLGCGVGGSVFYILEHLDTPAAGFGLTISPVQARLAAKTAAGKGFSPACLFLEADFQEAPLASGMDLVYSVEAFVHAPDPQRYLAGASRLLKPGGRLILCDDFLARPALRGEMDETTRTWLSAYREGWQVHSLYPPEELESMAGRRQLMLRRNEDLTPFLHLRRLPNQLALLLLRLGRRLPVRHAMLPSLLGSMALQECLHRGIVQYRFLVFEKQG